MRTTVTLEPDVAAKLNDLARRRGASFKATLNDVVRRGLAAERGAQARSRFVVEPHDAAFRPSIDPARLNQLLDELDVQDFVAKSRARPRRR